MQLFQRKAIVLLVVFVQAIFFNTYAATNWSVHWRPNGDYFATGGDYSTSNPLYLYSFNKNNCSFTLTDSRKMITAGDQIRAVAWSPNGNYLAVGVYTGGANAQLRIYSFNGSRIPGSPLVTQNYAQVGTAVPYLDAIAWHPSGNYIAIGGGNNPSSANYPLKIYSFNGSTLSQTDSKSILYMIRDINWDSTGGYLITGGNAVTGGPEVYTYSFNAGTLTQITTKAMGGDTCIDYFASLSPDNQFALLGGYTVTSNLELQVYPFNNGSLGSVLDSRNYGTYLMTAQFHPHQQYVAIGGETPDSGHEELEIYGFDSIKKIFTTNPITKISQANSVCSVDWSDDGRFLLIGGKGDVLNTYWSYYGGSKGLGLTSYDGTQYPIYLTSNTTLRTSEYARGSVTFAGGIAVAAGNGARLNLHTPVCKGLDLRGTGSLTLEHNLILDSNITLSNGGIIDAQGCSIMLYGDLYITPSSLVKFVSDAIIDGNGNNVTMGKYSQFFMDGGVTVTFKNMTIKNEINTISCPPIRCSDWYGKACFDNVIFALNDDFAFRNGQMFIHNDVDFTGTSKFSYRSVRPSYIAQHSNLIFDPQTTFEFYPSTTDNALIQMADKTSAIIFDDSTLLTTHTGIRLTKGSVYFDNKVTLSSTDNTAMYSIGAGINIGNYTALSIALSPDGRYLAIANTSANVLYRFNGNTFTYLSAFGSNGRAVAWSPDGKYLALGKEGAKSELYRLDGRSLTFLNYINSTSDRTVLIAWSPDGKYLALANYQDQVSKLYTFNGSNAFSFLANIDATTYSTYSVAWRPDGKYLALANAGAAEQNTLYSFNGSSATRVQYFGTANDQAISVAWSPNGNYLVCGNQNAPIKLYRFNSNSLSFVTNFDATTYATRSVQWSPDGKYVAVGNYYYPGWPYRSKIYRCNDNSMTSIGEIDPTNPGSWSVAWTPDGKYIILGNYTTYTRFFPLNIKYDTNPQSFRTGISFGDSALGTSYDLDVHSLAANRINLYGKLWQDSLNSWIFDSRDSYLSLNRYDSKFKITDVDSMSNWKKQHIIKSSQDNTLFLQDNQIWEANTDYNLAPEETFEFMNDLIIPDNQIVQLSSNAVIDGQGHNLILGKYSQLLVDGGITVTFKNMTIKNTLNTISCPPIRCMDWYSKACFDNTTLSFNDDFAFRNGQIFVHNDVNITGTSKFSYRSVRPSYITQHSNLIFDPNTTFEFYPSTTDNALIQMADKTSAIIFDGSTLQTTGTGIRLTKGSLYFDNKVTLSTSGSKAFGGISAQSNIDTAYNTYATAWSPDGKFLVLGNYGQVSRCYTFNGSSFAWLCNVDSAYNTLSAMWSPDGKYLVLGNDAQPSRCYKFNGSFFEFVCLVENTTQYRAFSGAWSPNGSFFVVGNWDAASPFRLSRMYRFTGSSFVYVCDVNTAGYYSVIAVAWSPDGKYLALGSNTATSKYYRFNGSSFTLIGELSATSYNCVGLSWSPDGRFLVQANWTHQSQLYQFSGSTFKRLGDVGTNSNASIAAAWSPDGQFLVLGKTDGTDKLYRFSDASFTLLADISTGVSTRATAWSPDGNFFVFGNGDPANISKFIQLYYKFDASPQGFRTGISFGNSTLGSAYDLDVHALAAARINLYGNLWQDSLNSWVFDSRDSYLSLNRYDSKFKITDADSMSNWKKQHIIKSSQDNTLFLQDNQIWESNTDYNLASEETFAFMNDLIIPDNQLVKLSSNAVIDGQGHTIILGKYAQLLVDGGITVTFKNMTIKNTLNTISCPPIRCMDWYSKACLDNVTLSFNDDCAFRNGQIFVHNDVNITGTSKFSYRSVCPSYIAQHSNLIFDPNTTFEFYPSTTDNQLIQMADKTSAIMFDGSTLQTTHTGMRLTKGSIFFDNKITLSSMDNTLLTTLSFKTTTTELDSSLAIAWSPDGRYLAVGNNNQTVKIKVYRQDGESLTLTCSIGGAVRDTRAIDWSPDGKYLAIGNRYQKNEIYAFNNGILNLTCLTAESDNTWSFMWHPSGKYIFASNYDQTGKLYSFDGSSLTKLSTETLGEDIAAAWTPDGRYLIIGRHANTSLMYKFDANVLTLVETINVGPYWAQVAITPDGKYLAISGQGAPLYLIRISGETLSLVDQTTKNFNSFDIVWSPNGKYLAMACNGGKNMIYRRDGEKLILVYVDAFNDTTYAASWRPDGKYLAWGKDLRRNWLVGVTYRYDTSPQGFSNSIVFGNSALGSAYDLDVNVLADARVDTFGNFMYDNVN